MENGVYLAATAWTLIPIILTIACVFLTKRILLSMMVGVLSSGFMVANMNLFRTIVLVEETFVGVFFPGNLFGVGSRWYFGIIIFLLGLGIITSFVVLTGGAQAFVNSVALRVKTRKGVQYISVAVGILLMIDDYFNAMINGNIGKTLAKEHKLSRTRVAYNVDSIAAPICIIAPVSSWAVAIMGNIETVYENLGLEGNIMMVFLSLIPYHFYVFAAIGLVLITIIFNFNLPAMKKFEDTLQATGTDESIDEGGENLLGEAGSSIGNLYDFWVPICVLVFVTVGTMFVTGYQGALDNDAFAGDGAFIYAVLGNWSLSMSLYLGGISGAVAAMYMGARHIKAGEITKEQFWKAVLAGIRSMSGAIAILTLSWMISSHISRLETGEFFAALIRDAGISPYFVPLIMFITAAVMAFCIGTSWGTFALVLPIAGAVAYQIDIGLLFPAMSAVLSGAVFGDHSSPISDTTVLASVGSSCKVVDHFQTQLPYAIMAAAIASVGYIAFGISGGNLFVGYIGFAAAIVATVIFVKFYSAARS